MGTRKRHSRKLAAILTVLAMVLALFPVAAFAQEQPTFSDIAGLKLAKEIEEAAKAGLVEGYPDGTFKPKQNVTRAEFAKMIVNALEKATGKALPTGEEPFPDVSEDSTLYEYVVKAYNAKLIQGYDNGRFGYSDPIQRQQAAAIIARALGLEETEENFPDVDPKYHRLAGLIGAVAKAGLMQGYDNGNFGPTDSVQRDQAAAIAVRTYNYLKQQQPAALKVAEVRAPNLKQVEVVFDQPVDKASAEDLANYRVYAEGTTANLVDGTGAAAAVQEDGKTVLLTLEDGAALKNNSKENKIEVLSGVKSAAGAALEKDYSATFAAVDTVTPTAVSVQQIGSRWLQVSFNEPVQLIEGKVAIRIDNGAIGVKQIKPDYATRSLLVTTYADIKEGEHTVTVRAKTVKDFAELENQVDQDLKFEAVKDETVPTVSVTKATPTQIKLAFSQWVVIPASDNIRFRAIYNTSKYEIKASDSSRIEGNIGSDNLVREITLKYDSEDTALPLGQQKLYIDYENDNSSNVIKSAYGVTVPEQALDLTIEADTVKPAVTKVEVVGADQLRIVFNKDVDEETAEDPDNYTVKDPDGNEVAIENIEAKGNVVTLTLSKAFTGGTYTLTVSGVKDTAYPKNVMDEYTTTFEAEDKTAPTVVGGYPKYVAESAGGYKVFILFSEPMATSGLGSVLDLGKYRVNGKALDKDKDEVEVSQSDRLVVITLNKDWSVPSSLEIDFVTDKAGNALPREHRSFTSIAEGGVEITEAKFVAKDRLEVTFDAPLTEVEADDFNLVVAEDLTEDGKAVGIAGVENRAIKNGVSVVTFALTGKVKANATGKLTTVSDPDGTATAEGLPLKGDQDEDVKDAIAPSLVENDPVVIAPFVDGSGAVINVRFDEPIDPQSFGKASFKVTGYDYPAESVALVGDGSVIEVRVKARPGASKQPNVELVTPVLDESGNTSGTWTKKAVVAAPSIGLSIDSQNAANVSATVTASNPANGLYYRNVRFRVTVEGPTDGLNAIVQSLESKVDWDDRQPADGKIVGYWGPREGFPVEPPYNAESKFSVDLRSAPGAYTVTVEMVAGYGTTSPFDVAKAGKSFTVVAPSQDVE